jgi:serine/threonine kinase 16
VLITSSGIPVLIDFNSVRKAEVKIETRQQSLKVIDEATAFCTISYRAPELFDPPRGKTIDARSDVWALGCLLYAWWFGYSPFECEFSDKDVIKCVECTHLRVLADISRPKKPSSEDKKILAIVEWLLNKNFSLRPSCADVINRIDTDISSLAVVVDDSIGEEGLRI